MTNLRILDASYCCDIDYKGINITILKELYATNNPKLQHLINTDCPLNH